MVKIALTCSIFAVIVSIGASTTQFIQLHTLIAEGAHRRQGISSSFITNCQRINKIGVLTRELTANSFQATPTQLKKLSPADRKELLVLLKQLRKNKVFSESNIKKLDAIAVKLDTPDSTIKLVNEDIRKLNKLLPIDCNEQKGVKNLQ